MPADVLQQVLLPRLGTVHRNGTGFSARCPAHPDNKPSLSVSVGDEQPAVLHCHAGCTPEAILDAIGLTFDDLSNPRPDRRDEPGEWTPYGPATAAYRYVDEQGTLLFEVLRTADKQFPCRVPDPARKTGWRWKLGDTRRVLYRLPQVIDAIKDGRPIVVVEGEKDVHTLDAHGLVGTCNPGGAGKWRDDFAEPLRDAYVTIVADKDDTGQAHARQVAASLDGVADTVRIVEAATGKDTTDHFAAGHGWPDFVETWTSDEPPKRDLAPDLWEFIAVEDPPYDWIVPDLLERGDRLMVTGFEGLGKSMLVRQMATMIAAGLHPFTRMPIEPRRVLLVDLENTERQSRRKFRPLAAASIKFQRRVPDGALRLIHRPEGIDVTRDDDAAWLLERVTAHQPDVLFIGPIYRLHHANLNEELPARRAVAVLDAARTKVDCALVVEAHAGHSTGGVHRSVRPVGSSLFLRWPEFGFGLAPDPDIEVPAGKPVRDVIVKPWRGGRDERTWPTRLTWGDPWPWQLPPEPAHKR